MTISELAFSIRDILYDKLVDAFEDNEDMEVGKYLKILDTITHYPLIAVLLRGISPQGSALQREQSLYFLEFEIVIIVKNPMDYEGEMIQPYIDIVIDTLKSIEEGESFDSGELIEVDVTQEIRDNILLQFASVAYRVQKWI